jgi:hypothetical protein
MAKANKKDQSEVIRKILEPGVEWSMTSVDPSSGDRVTISGKAHEGADAAQEASNASVALWTARKEAQANAAQAAVTEASPGDDGDPPKAFDPTGTIKPVDPKRIAKASS